MKKLKKIGAIFVSYIVLFMNKVNAASVQIQPIYGVQPVERVERVNVVERGIKLISNIVFFICVPVVLIIGLAKKNKNKEKKHPVIKAIAHVIITCFIMMYLWIELEDNSILVLLAFLAYFIYCYKGLGTKVTLQAIGVIGFFYLINAIIYTCI